MKSIYETKSYKLILSYYTNTKLHKNNDKNIIRADTYYGRNNHCLNEGYDYDL